MYPSKTKLIESVYASVTVQPDSLYQVHAAVAGILDENLVEEGDTINKGAPLFQIINTTPKLNAENAKLALQLARENYYGSAAILGSLKDELRFVLLVSKVTLAAKADAQNAVDTQIDGLTIAVSKTGATKCVRCWHHSETVGSDERHPTLRGRCVENVEGDGEVRHYA